MKNKKLSTLAAYCLLGAGGPAAAAERVVGAVAPEGGAHFVKQFNVPAGTVVTGVEFVTNDLRTVFPWVALLEGAATKTSEAVVLREVSGVRGALRHRLQVAFPAFRVTESRDLWVAIALPPSDGVRGLRDGDGLKAVDLETPNGSYLASGSIGLMQPLELELAIDLILQSSAKAQQNESRQQTTFLRVASTNPTASGAQIELGLERSMPVVLAVYTVAGQRVRLLADTTLNAGVHPFAWDGRSDAGQAVAAGVYIAKLKTPETSLTNKVVIVR